MPQQWRDSRSRPAWRADSYVSPSFLRCRTLTEYGLAAKPTVVLECIKQAGHKKTGSAHMREQARDDVRVVDEGWEDRRGLNARKQLSQRLCQRARPARIGFQRLLVDEVDHRDAGDLIDIMDIRCNPGLRRD